MVKVTGLGVTAALTWKSGAQGSRASSVVIAAGAFAVLKMISCVGLGGRFRCGETYGAETVHLRNSSGDAARAFGGCAGEKRNYQLLRGDVEALGQTSAVSPWRGRRGVVLHKPGVGRILWPPIGSWSWISVPAGDYDLGPPD